MRQDIRKNQEINLDLSKIVDVEIDGIKRWDYPDFVDSYITKAYIDLGNKDFRELTEEELEYLNEREREFVYQKVVEYIT